MTWFRLTGPNPTLPSDYTEAAPSGCTGTNKICAVQANSDSNNEPELTDALKDEMILALHNRSASANVQLKS